MQLWLHSHTETGATYMEREEGIEQNKFNLQNNGKEKQEQGKALTIKAVYRN